MDLFAPPTAAELDARLAAAGIQAMAAAAPPSPSRSSPLTNPTTTSTTVAVRVEHSPPTEAEAAAEAVVPTKRLALQLPTAPLLPQWNPMDELWRSPVTGAGVYVGNRQAAMDEGLLVKHKISTIIVCAGEQKRHHDEGKFKYVTFLVANWATDLMKHAPATPGEGGGGDAPDIPTSTLDPTPTPTLTTTTTPTPTPTLTTTTTPTPTPNLGAAAAAAAACDDEQLNEKNSDDAEEDVPFPVLLATAAPHGAAQAHRQRTSSVFRTTARLRGEHTRHPTAAATQAMAESFFQPVFDAVDAAIDAGESVLVHCMAGAHRAGTVGMAIVMRQSAGAGGGGGNQKFAPYEVTLAAARKRRPILDPDLVSTGTAVHLLKLLDGSWEKANGKSSAKSMGSVAAPAAGNTNISRGLVASYAASSGSTFMVQRFQQMLQRGVPRATVEERCRQAGIDAALLGDDESNDDDGCAAATPAATAAEQRGVVGVGAAKRAGRSFGGLFSSDNADGSKALVSMVQRMLAHLQSGAKREDVVAAAATRSGKMPEEIRRMLREAEETMAAAT